ncbi:MAG: AI-2E family transporter [Deltaproteobacteria bacterium]
MISSPRGGRDRPSVEPLTDAPSGEPPGAGRRVDNTRNNEPPEIQIGEIWGHRRIIFLVCSALFVLLVAWMTREVVLPFILAIIIAYVLTPLVGWCERRGLRRAVSIIVVYTGTIAVLSTSLALIAPRIYRETLGLTRESPQIARRLALQWGPIIEARIESLIDLTGPPGTPRPQLPGPSAALEVSPRPDGSIGINVGTGVEIVQESPNVWLIREHEPDVAGFRVTQLLNDGVENTVHYLRGNGLQLFRFGQAIVSGVSRGVFLTFMTLMVAAYLMLTRDQIFGFFRSLVPPRSRRSFDRLLYRMDRGLAGVVRGQLVICCVNGVLSAIGFVIFGLKYWPVMALIAGIMSIIPIFGSILSSIPAVLIGLTQSFFTAFWVLVWILLIHQLEANLLNPKIIGVAARLHPVLVVFVLIVGEHFFGLWGALLAVPTLSLTHSLFSHFRLESMPDVPPDSVALTTPPTPLE